MEALAKALLLLKQNTIGNYISPGLESSLLPDRSVRIFHQTREQTKLVTPHSHRFDMHAIVLEGGVTNTTWMRVSDRRADLFRESTLTYNNIGDYERRVEGDYHYGPISRHFVRGEAYSIPHGEIHSIVFKKGSVVLVFEGIDQGPETRIIEPVVYNVHTPLLDIQPWMFQRKVLK